MSARNREFRGRFKHERHRQLPRLVETIITHFSALKLIVSKMKSRRSQFGAINNEVVAISHIRYVATLTHSRDTQKELFFRFRQIFHD